MALWRSASPPRLGLGYQQFPSYTAETRTYFIRIEQNVIKVRKFMPNEFPVD